MRREAAARLRARPMKHGLRPYEAAPGRHEAAFGHEARLPPHVAKPGGVRTRRGRTRSTGRGR